MSENIEVTVNDATPQVFEMLGNLARRITSLEDQLDSVSRNQVKLAEEIANENHVNDAESFRVGSVDYTVELVPKLSHLYELFGQITYDDTNIQIDADLSPSRRNDVIIHELMHAIFFEAGVTEQNEDLINRVAHVLAQVLRDNDFTFMRGDGE